MDVPNSPDRPPGAPQAKKAEKQVRAQTEGRKSI